MAGARKSPAQLPGLMKRALRLQEGGAFAEAEALYREILSIDPLHADAYHLLGVMASSLGRPDIAVDMIGQAIRLRGDVPSYYNNLAIAFYAQRKLDEAIMLYRHALTLDPALAGACNNLAVALAETGAVEEALGFYARALAQTPDNGEVMNNFAVALRYAGRPDESTAMLRRMLERAPDHADAHWNLAFNLLLAGAFDEGWRESEWRWKVKDATPHGLTVPQWDGGDLNGRTVLLHCEQGLGDGIQFIRYAPMVKAKGGAVILAGPPDILSLFRDMPGIDHFGYEGQALPVFDCHAPLMSLPGIFRTTLETIPGVVPYLHAEPARCCDWRARLSGLDGFKVGVAWRGRPTHKNDRNRSMNAATMAAVLNVPGLAVVSLQKDAAADELEALAKNGNPVFDAGPFLNGFEDTAAAIAALDLVISVDTSVCHLAGAMGAPVWTLLPFAPDWRWLLNRIDTPWYPTMRLFRQGASGDWGAVQDAVRAALEKRIAATA